MQYAGDQETEDGFRFSWVESRNPSFKRRKVRRFRVLKHGAHAQGAFHNISHAIDYAKEGDRISVAQGEWQGNVTIPRHIELCADSDADEPPVIHTREDICVACKSHSGCYIRGLSLQCRGTISGYALAVIEGEARVEECEVEGVKVEGEADFRGILSMRKCQVPRSADYGVWVHHGGYASFSACRFGSRKPPFGISNRSIFICSVGETEFAECEIYTGKMGLITVAGGDPLGDSGTQAVSPVFRRCKIIDSNKDRALAEEEERPMPCHPDIVSPLIDGEDDPTSGAAVLVHTGASPRFENCNINSVANGVVCMDAQVHFEGSLATDISDCDGFGIVFRRTQPDSKVPDPNVQNVSISNCKRGAIRFYEDAASQGVRNAAYIADSTFYANPGPCVVLQGRGCCPEFKDCNFVQQTESPAVVAVGCAGGRFEKCDFQENVLGVTVDTRASPTFLRCQWKDCRTAVVAEAFGEGRFIECSFTGCGLELGAVVVRNRAHPIFIESQWFGCGQSHVFKDHPPGSSVVIEECGRGKWEKCVFRENFPIRPTFLVRQGGNPTVVNGEFRNSEIGVSIEEGGRGRLVDNRFEELSTGCLIQGGDPVLKGNCFDRMRSCGVWVRNVGALATVLKCEFGAGIGPGVLCDWGGNPSFRLNAVGNPLGTGVQIKYGGKGEWKNNKLIGSAVNVDVDGARPRFSLVRFRPLRPRKEGESSKIYLGALELFDRDGHTITVVKTLGGVIGLNAVRNQGKSWAGDPGDDLIFVIRPSEVAAYRLTTGKEDPGGDPAEWVLEGSLRSEYGPWCHLDAQRGEGCSLSRERLTRGDILHCSSGMETAPVFCRNQIGDAQIRGEETRPDKLDEEEEEWHPMGGGVQVWIHSRHPKDTLAGVTFRENDIYGDRHNRALVLLDADSEGQFYHNRFRGNSGAGAGVLAQLRGGAALRDNVFYGGFSDGALYLRRQCKLEATGNDIVNNRGPGVIAEGDS
eukprot:Hpha_TRINITY_DN22452_c0_g1::TRINITY_DN22452_c0_g1_i1::g.94970::m.94970